MSNLVSMVLKLLGLSYGVQKRNQKSVNTPVLIMPMTKRLRPTVMHPGEGLIEENDLVRASLKLAEMKAAPQRRAILHPLFQERSLTKTSALLAKMAIRQLLSIFVIIALCNCAENVCQLTDLTLSISASDLLMESF